MKGPFERIKYEMRRLWECPECHHRYRTGGDQTSAWCDCTTSPAGRPTPMKLLEDGIRRQVQQ